MSAARCRSEWRAGRVCLGSGIDVTPRITHGRAGAHQKERGDCGIACFTATTAVGRHMLDEHHWVWPASTLEPCELFTITVMPPGSWSLKVFNKVSVAGRSAGTCTWICNSLATKSTV